MFRHLEVQIFSKIWYQLQTFFLFGRVKCSQQCCATVTILEKTMNNAQLWGVFIHECDHFVNMYLGLYAATERDEGKFCPSPWENRERGNRVAVASENDNTCWKQLWLVGYVVHRESEHVLQIGSEIHLPALLKLYGEQHGRTILELGAVSEWLWWNTYRVYQAAVRSFCCSIRDTEKLCSRHLLVCENATVTTWSWRGHHCSWHCWTLSRE